MFITPTELGDSLIESALRTVEGMPIESVQKIAATPLEVVAFGVKAGLCVALVMAARERLKEEHLESPLIP